VGNKIEKEVCAEEGKRSCWITATTRNLAILIDKMCRRVEGLGRVGRLWTYGRKQGRGQLAFS